MVSARNEGRNVGLRWDDIEILRQIDRHQQQHGGGELWHVNGMQLMEEIAGRLVAEQHRHFGFVQELHNLRDAGLLRFQVTSSPAGNPPQPGANPYYYLQQVSRFTLTVAGQDRARGRVVFQPPPDPAEDDGRPISRLILKHVAAAIEDEYRPDQIPQFLREAGIPLDRVPVPAGASEDDVTAVLVTLDRWGSEGRRTLRCFVGRWLDDRLHTGPSNELRVTLIEQLARQGWYLNDDRLVVGEPATGQRVASPVLREARLAALQPQVASIAARYIGTGLHAEAVFESMKAVVNRVKDMTSLDLDGVALMNRAFSADHPQLDLSGSATTTGQNIHAGYRFLFVGAVQAIRNPSAHEQLDKMDEDEAFEQLNLASLLMRRLDKATKPIIAP
jgi:uncharacterized protein (TIGR02391 family)